MSRRLLCLPAWLLALSLLLPGLALAAPTPIGLAEYQAMLRQGVAHLERAERFLQNGRNTEAAEAVRSARPFLAGAWRVETPHGTANGDLTALAGLVDRASRNLRETLPRALAAARDHLAAAEALGQAQPAEVPGARQTLNAALQQGAARTLLQRLQDWWRELLGRRAAAPLEKTTRETWYVGGVIAILALSFLGFQLYRTLSRQSAPADAALKTGRDGRQDRPLTPAELRRQARQLSEQGDHLAGLRTAHLALLQHYDAARLIRYVPAQTNREHEWQLRRRSPSLARSLRTLHDLVDDRLYSGHGATAEDFMKVDALVDQLWREGDAVSKSAEATTGA